MDWHSTFKLWCKVVLCLPKFYWYFFVMTLNRVTSLSSFWALWDLVRASRLKYRIWNFNFKVKYKEIFLFQFQLLIIFLNEFVLNIMRQNFQCVKNVAIVFVQNFQGHFFFYLSIELDGYSGPLFVLRLSLLLSSLAGKCIDACKSLHEVVLHKQVYFSFQEWRSLWSKISH